MADEKTSETPMRNRAVAETSVAGAKQAVDDFLAVMRATMTRIEAFPTEVTAGVGGPRETAPAQARPDLAAAFEHARRLVAAKDRQEIERLQREYSGSRALLDESTRRTGGVAAAVVAGPTGEAGEG